MDLRVNIDCMFYRQGSCVKGNNCPFRHVKLENEPNQREQIRELCIYHQQGYCARGTACFYRHGDTPAQKIECEKASGSFLDPSTEKASRLEKLRQEVRDKMTKPLSAESRRSDEGQQASVTEKLPGPEPSSSEVELKRFGSAARNRALAAGVLPLQSSSASQGDVQSSKVCKRMKAPIVWGCAQLTETPHQSSKKMRKTSPDQEGLQSGTPTKSHRTPMSFTHKAKSVVAVSKTLGFHNMAKVQKSADISFVVEHTPSTLSVPNGHNHIKDETAAGAKPSTQIQNVDQGILCRDDEVPDEFASAEEIEAPLSDDGTFHHGNGDEDYDAELDDLEKEFN